MLTDVLRNEPTPEADSYGVGSTSCLKLRQQMAHVRLHRLLGEEQSLADLAIDETVCHELEHLDLAGGRVLAELTRSGRREGDHRAAASRATTRRSRLEPAAVVAVTVQDLPALSGVHEFRIGAAVTPL
jgi:hypothetical protein